MKAIKTALQTILYLLLVVGLHLTLIYILDIRIEGWKTELIKELGKVYLLPLFLCFINSLILVKALRTKYHVIWLLVTIIPSCCLLFFFKAIQGLGEGEYQVVSIEMFPKYSLEMFTFLPRSILVLQFVFTLYFLIKIRKEVNRSKI
ncbi:hypothetical protein [Paenibacillus ihuae]|uniref:hypothetical protein n=1 Tax=Paenibacillus ihuae TaxID=1232431 RepID=UPI0006D542C1|nr:hypothetical protein [Paenibacillus ihuae]